MFTNAVLRDEEKHQMIKLQGAIKGKGDGKRCRVTINRDGRIVLGRRSRSAVHGVRWE